MKRGLEKIGSIYLITDTIAGFEDFLSDAGFMLVRAVHDDY